MLFFSCLRFPPLEFVLDGLADELGHLLLADERLDPLMRCLREPDDGRFQFQLWLQRWAAHLLSP